MPNITSVTQYFPRAVEGFVTTLGGTISAGATTMIFNSTAGYSVGDVGVWLIEPGGSNEQAFTGTVATGNSITGVVWTKGSNNTHNTGAIIVDYTTSTGFDMHTAGILVQHNQDGSHKNITATSVSTGSLTATGTVTAGNFVLTGGAGSNGWSVGVPAPNTVVYNGNRSYTLTWTGTDQTSILSPGMRLRTTRTVAAPTQCTTLNGTTQFFSKASPNGLTFTNNFAVSAWVKLSSYPASFGTIGGRATGTNGFYLGIDNTGAVALKGFNGGGSNVSQVASIQNIPLNKWVHIVAQLDMATFTASPTTSYVMIDGQDVVASVSRSGTNPTSITQAGNLEVGSFNSGTFFFPGKIAQFAIFSAKVAEATMQGYYSQGLAGTETSLVSAFSFNNSLNDLNTTNANNLTNNNGASITTADAPWGGQAGGAISSTLDYGVVEVVAFSTNTTAVVQVPEGCTIPTSGGVSSIVYSSLAVPYGFPADKSKWVVAVMYRSELIQASPAANTWYNVGSVQLLIPTGAWRVQFHTILWSNATNVIGNTALSYTAASGTAVTGRMTCVQYNSAGTLMGLQQANDGISLSTPTTVYLNAALSNTAGSVEFYWSSNNAGGTYIEAECAYI
jgi:hypothetical protein